MQQIIIGLFIMILIACNQQHFQTNAKPYKSSDTTHIESARTELQVLASFDGGFYYVHKIKGIEVRDGVEVDFYHNGKVKTITNYENGKVNGVWLRLNKNGSVCFMTRFINGYPIELKHCSNGKIGDFYDISCGCDL